MIFTSKVPTNVRSPVAAAEYLAQRFTYHNMDEWGKIILEGRIRINGNPYYADSVVIAGDTISYDPGNFDEPDADLSYTVIYEDEWVFGVNKPQNLLVHRAGRSFRNNLVYRLRHAHTPPYPNCHPIHRLDKDTAGVILFAKDAVQKAVFGKLFNDGKVTRIYKAVVAGSPNLELPFTIDTPIAADTDSGLSYKFRVDTNGKPAVTIIENIRYLHENRSIMTIKPLTGRTHQIRVHLASIGFPIIGDRLYGTEGDERQALHCESLSFIHPHTNCLCGITASLPDNFF